MHRERSVERDAGCVPRSVEAHSGAEHPSAQPLTAPERQAAHDVALGDQGEQHRRDHRDHRAHRHEPELHAARVDARPRCAPAW